MIVLAIAKSIEITLLEAVTMDATEREKHLKQEELSNQSSMNPSSVIPKNEPSGRIDIDDYNIAVLIASGWGS